MYFNKRYVGSIDKEHFNAQRFHTDGSLAIIIKTTMDARDEILKYLLEKKDNRRMIDITELVKSLGLEPIQLRSVLEELKSENLAEIDSAVKVGNIPGSINNLGNKTLINKVKHEIDLNDIIYISGRINLNGENYLAPRISVTNIKGNNNVVGNDNYYSKSSKKIADKTPVTTATKIIITVVIGLFVTVVGGLILNYFIKFL